MICLIGKSAKRSCKTISQKKLHSEDRRANRPEDAEHEILRPYVEVKELVSIVFISYF